MELLLISFIAGVLTMLAPCTLSLLPVILGGSVGGEGRLRPLIVTSSLLVSIVIFTLLLKFATLFFVVPDIFWKYVSGGLILVFGLIMLFPGLWSKLSFKLKLYKSEQLMSKSSKIGGYGGAILLGMALGPVFTTCSPTYALLLAVVLPESFVFGFVNLLLFSLGLGVPLLLIGYGGQKIVKKFKFASDPNGWFKKLLAFLLIVTGLLVLTGFDKRLEAYILKSGYLGPVEIEQLLLENIK